MRSYLLPTRLFAITAFCALAGLPLAATIACGLNRSEVLRSLSDGPPNEVLVQNLRCQGPAALEWLFRLRDELAVEAKANATASNQQVQQLARLDELIDQVGRQRYCSRSRLYWYTDFDQALAAAQRTGKPIVSLRLLGKLNEDFSCANSRFFRTTLYANEDISRRLRDDCILHWQSVRPVPKVTIDFGDGRKLERTLTGNSIHYILTPEGEVVDALPGLYGPQAFLEQIDTAITLAKRFAALPATERKAALAAFHVGAMVELNSAWTNDLAMSGTGANRIPSPKAAAPGANAAMAVAVPKGAVEMPMLKAAIPLAIQPAALNDETLWQAIAALHAGDAVLDDASRELIRSQNPAATQAGRIAITKAIIENPLARMLRSFEASIALDTIKNEYQRHWEIHRWLADPGFDGNLDALNERVYAELFLTPSSDAWLGLAPADVYTALPNGGVVKQ